MAKQKEPECGPRPHDELAILLCNELLKKPTERTADEVKLYTRTLHMLNKIDGEQGHSTESKGTYQETIQYTCSNRQKPTEKPV